MSSRVKKNVVLIGMPGCGKSVIGEMLSKDIGYEFCDMDKYIEKMSGKTIKELFEVSEKHFRDLESKSCEELAKEERLVIASGGGVIKRGENIQELKRSSLVVFINRPINNILADIDISGRPLLKDGKERLYKLYNEE